MKNKFFYTLAIIVVLATVTFITWKNLTSIDQPIIDPKYYANELDTIKQIRKSLAQENAGIKKLKKQFLAAIDQKVFRYWYGTKWDYNGTTEKPQQGAIACGYFVTTTLRDMGVPLNRVKLAQCASEEMIRSLTTKKNIHHLGGISLVDFEQKLNKLGDGLYIVGLDNHTGYILISEQGNFFIHSSGWFPFKVMKQKVSESDVLAKSKYRVVGKISDDEIFLKKWVSGNS